MKILRHLPADIGRPIETRTLYEKEGRLYTVVETDGGRIVYEEEEQRQKDGDGLQRQEEIQVRRGRQTSGQDNCEPSRQPENAESLSMREMRELPSHVWELTVNR